MIYHLPYNILIIERFYFVIKRFPNIYINCISMNCDNFILYLKRFHNVIYNNDRIRPVVKRTGTK